MGVRIVNYNHQFSDVKDNEEIKELYEELNFNITIVDGDIGTNIITLEILSILPIDCDVEFYGFESEVEYF